MVISRRAGCLLSYLGFAAAVLAVFAALTSWSSLPIWLIIAITLITAWLLLHVWGYLLGPQGEPPVTKRDHRILERRARYATPGKRRLLDESFELATKVVNDARTYRGRGVSDRDAFHQALNELTDRMVAVIYRFQYAKPVKRDYAIEHTTERFVLLLRTLVTHGVISDHGPITDPYPLLYSEHRRRQLIELQSLDNWPQSLTR